jgi:hypothetical protein
MSARATTSKKCSRCGTAVESCAFCDEPDCPAIVCFRCASIAFFDRLRPKSTPASPVRG